LVRGDIGQRILEPDDWFLPHKGSSPGANIRYLQVWWWWWWDWSEKKHDHTVIILATVHILPIMTWLQLRVGCIECMKVYAMIPTSMPILSCMENFFACNSNNSL